MEHRVASLLKHVENQKQDTALAEYVKANPKNVYMVNMLIDEYDRKLKSAYCVIDRLKQLAVVLLFVFASSEAGLCNSKDAVKKDDSNQANIVTQQEAERHAHNETIVRMQSIRARVTKMPLTDIGYYKFAKKVDLSDLALRDEAEVKFFKMLIDSRYQLNKDYFDEVGDGRVVAFVEKDEEISQPGLAHGINYSVELTPTNS